MGSAVAEGEDRAINAVKAALTSPLLNDNDINSARYVLLNITYGNKEVMMDEITDITDYIQDAAGATADVIWGHGFDASLGDKLSITLIATGFSPSKITDYEKAPERVVISMGEDNGKEITAPLQTPIQQIPTVTEQLAQAPFLKTEEPSIGVLNSTPIVTPISTPVQEEKKSFNLFEQAPVQETTRVQEVTPEATNTVEPQTTFTIQEESKVEEKVVTSEPVQKYSWDIIDVKTPEVKSETPVAAVPSTPEYVAPKTEEPLIIRHELNLEPKATTTIDNSSRKEVLSPEEMNRRTSERMSKIQELTTKLKKAEGIAEFENEPAYVRRNINLNYETPSTETSYSKFGLSGNADGSATLRGNNFLHDNVD
jgi:cell division protein FtsZ